MKSIYPGQKKHFYKIGEIAEYLNVKTSLLRFWEKEFSALIKPARNKKGDRMYSHNDFDTFKKIHLLVKVESFTLKGAKKKIHDEKKIYNEKDEAINSLIKLKEFLTEIKKLLLLIGYFLFW